MQTHFLRLLSLAVVFCVWACSNRGETDEPTWEVVHEELDSALLSVWGTSASDVWAVGGDPDDGDGPLVIHYDGSDWERLETGQSDGTLWWIFGFEDGPIFTGGAGGVILRYEDGEFTRMQTPGNETVFGIWGASPDDVWAVGGASESGGGFAWRLDGQEWIEEPSVPNDVPAQAALWKVYGTSADDAWLVGSNGVALHWDGEELSGEDTGVGSSLFTVHQGGDHYTAVGGLVTGIIVEYDSKWRDVTPDPVPDALSGVCLDDSRGGFAVGAFGTIYKREQDGWHEEDTGLAVGGNLHAVWLDPEGGVWAVGGQTYSEPFADGVMVHRGKQHPVGGL